jgi:hypothetical protein
MLELSLVLLVLLLLVRTFGEENVFAKLGLFSDFELTQVNYYLDSVAPNYTHFNVENYNTRLRECTELYRKPNEHVAMLDCYDRATHEYSKLSALWTPQKKENGNHEPDCKYDIIFEGVWSSIEGVTDEDDYNLVGLETYRFRIESNSCLNDTVHVQGGSTFHAFGYTSQGLASCLVQDHFNSSYSLYCRSIVLKFPFSAESYKMPTPDCLSLTLILEYEHYDAYSLILDVWTTSYTSPQLTLVDDKQYCDGGNGLTIPSNHRSVATTKPPSDIVSTYMVGGDRDIVESGTVLRSSLELSSLVQSNSRTFASSLSIYSGIWTSHGLATELPKGQMSCVPFHNHGMVSDLIIVHSKCPPNMVSQPSTYSSLLSCYRNDSASSDMLSLWASHQECYLQGIQYTTRHNKQMFPTYAAGEPIPAIVNSTRLPNRYAFKATKQAIRIDTTRIDSRYKLPIIHKLDNIMHHRSTTFYFVGASHLRYLVFTLLSHLFGEGTIAKISRKTEAIEYTGTNLRHNTFTYQFAAYVHEQASVIKRICALPPKVPVGRKRADLGGNVLILQTGDWELTVGKRK